MTRVLIADDERPLREALVRFVRTLNMEAEAVSNGNEAANRLGSCDVLLSDVRMRGMDGISLLAEARRRRPGLPVILLTGHGTLSLAVEAMRNGAANFLTRPFDLGELEEAIRAALGGRADGKEDKASDGGDLIGESPAMETLRAMIGRVAQSDATVLVTGESGTGKEVVARSIHAQSCRARAPFVAVSCGAIPGTLLESELFGHVKGAFTGATQARVGRFGAAEGGTLLLDEIGEMPPHLQVKLLRVLKERAYTPVGASQPRPADVRVIAATNGDLEAMVAAGTFREDLYYRLNVLPVAVPALRDRADDVLLLARAFLARAAAAEGRGAMSFDGDVATCLRRYGWPGNVRELSHAVTRAAVLAASPILGLADLPAKVRAAFAAAEIAPEESAEIAPAVTEAGIDLNATLSDLERRLIQEALQRTGGNKNRAAALLKINRTTLVEKLKRLR